MAGKPMSVAFVGTGEVTEANVKGLLDDWLSEKDSKGNDREYNPPIIPTGIKRTHKGLARCRDWLEAEFGDDVETLPVEDIVTELLAQRNDEDDPASIYLVYIPGEDDPHLAVVEEAIKQGIPVKDMTAGLDDFEATERERVEEEKSAGRRTRGRARAESQPELPKADPDDPPWNTDDEAAESASKASAEPDVQSPTEGADSPAAASTASPSAVPAGGMAVVLSQATIELMLQFHASMAADIRASIVADIPAAKPPKPQTIAAYYNDAEDSYRRVEGRGRPRAGETRVELTEEQAKQLGL